MSPSPPDATGLPPPAAAATDPVGLSWLVTVRWTTLLAGGGAMLASETALGSSAPIGPAAAMLAACGLSNVWLAWRVRSEAAARLATLAGLFVCGDVLLISWILSRSGGVLNPASVFYLVLIVVAALVLGRSWTWIVTALSVGGYAMLFLASPAELRSAQSMHPEIALHMRGMWLAFGVTAVIIAILVARLATAVERRDHALDVLRDRSARASRLASLATLAAGAAHELSTPLSTIAVASRELERSLAEGHGGEDWQRDARLIRLETSRCRGILDAMAGGREGLAEAPRPAPFSEILALARDLLPAGDRSRVIADLPDDLPVVWPVRVVSRALANLMENALQASAAPVPVQLRARSMNGCVHVSVIDSGAGMVPGDLGRAGEPFFTTKPAGTGLGLFVARSSVEQLGGSLTLTSEPGQGTTASIVLPPDVVRVTTEDHA